MKKLDAHEQFVAAIAWGRQTNTSAAGGGESQDDVAGRPVNVMATCSSDKVIMRSIFLNLNLNLYIHSSSDMGADFRGIDGEDLGSVSHCFPEAPPSSSS